VSAAALTVDVQRLVAEAAAWRVLGRVFERPTAAWTQELEALAAEPLDAAVVDLARRAAAEGSEAYYLALLGPGGVASPREVAYRSWLDPGQLLAELTANYDAFAYHPETEECLDHVAVLSGFVGYLRMKEAYALAGGEAEAAAVVAEAAAAFLSEHLAPLAAGLAAKLGDGASFYLAEAAVLLAERSGDPPAPAAALPLFAADDDSFECGGCPDG
jgi:hypothetical protein